MLELRGSEKQVKWAEDIRNAILEKLNEKEDVLKWLEGQKEKQIANNTWGDAAEKEAENFKQVLAEIEEKILAEENAKWFIDKRDYFGTLREMGDLLSIPAKDAHIGSPAFDILDKKIKSYNNIIKIYRRSNKLKLETYRR